MLYHVNLFIGHYTVHMAFRESVTDFFFHLGPNLLQLNKAPIIFKINEKQCVRYFSSSFISYYQPVLQNTCLYHTNSKACLKCYSSISSQISSTYLNFTQFYYISHSINNNIFF